MVEKLNVSSGSKRQYQTLRFFPANDKKYCYTLNTTERTRYLLRATFLYGNFDNSSAYPKFSLYLDATPWATINVADPEQIYIKEMIFRAASSSISVCVLDASTGNPFISTLELRAFNGSMYATDYEEDFFLKVTARINFGASSKEPIRHLENNKLRGPLPMFFADLPRLQELYVQNNQLSGTVPKGLFKRNITFLGQRLPKVVVSSLLVETHHFCTVTCSDSRRTALDWISRLHIAKDAAKGLEYLHSGCNPSIIHRDIKSSNILLDIHMRAKVSDFGLSRLADEEMTHVSSAVRGTVGYVDPEYYATQQLTEKSDVYSFGVVLLELISGRKPISAQDYGADLNIVHWARSLIRKGDIHGIIDPALGSNFKVESVWKIAEVAILSVEPHGLSRPTMNDILQAIQEAIRIEKGNEAVEEDVLDLSTGHPRQTSILSSSLDNASSDVSTYFSNQQLLPTVR